MPSLSVSRSSQHVNVTMFNTIRRSSRTYAVPTLTALCKQSLDSICHVLNAYLTHATNTHVACNVCHHIAGTSQHGIQKIVYGSIENSVGSLTCCLIAQEPVATPELIKEYVQTWQVSHELLESKSCATPDQIHTVPCQQHAAAHFVVSVPFRSSFSSADTFSSSP